jgi:acyl carrier protein
MVSEQDVREAIASVVTGVDVAAIAGDKLFADAGIDSLDHANILLELQEQHGLIVPDEALDECRTIEGIVDFARRSGS